MSVLLFARRVQCLGGGTITMQIIFANVQISINSALPLSSTDSQSGHHEGRLGVRNTMRLGLASSDFCQTQDSWVEIQRPEVIRTLIDIGTVQQRPRRKRLLAHK